MVSVIVPHWGINQDLEDKLERCIKSLSGYDELILVVNDGIGFAKAVNKGLKLAKGDFLFVISNDTYITSGTLQELCDVTAVTTPIVNNVEQDFWGCFFCVPRWAYEKVVALRDGYQFLDEQFEIGFFEDDNLIMELRQLGIPMLSKPVLVKTEGGQTMKEVKENVYGANQERFKQKWGKLNSKI